MDDREESIMADLYAGAPVDLITVDCESIGTYANAGILYPLDELIERIGEDDFIPGSRVQIDGHDYGFPYAGCSMQMFIRTDLLEEAGLLLEAEGVPVEWTPEGYRVNLKESGWKNTMEEAEALRARFDKEEI